MSLKAELAALKQRDPQREAATIVVGVLIIALTWIFFPEVKYFILAVAPVASSLSHATNRGVGIRRTPRLYALLILACTTYLIAIAHLLNHFKTAV